MKKATSIASLQGRDYVEVCPAHISGSPCGRAMSGKPSSTIGFERRYNGALQHAQQQAFVSAIFADLHAMPQTFTDTIAANRGELRGH